MKIFTFKEKRNGKLRHIAADTAIEAAEAMTIYPWAFSLVSSVGICQSPPNKPSEFVAVDDSILKDFATYAEAKLAQAR